MQIFLPRAAREHLQSRQQAFAQGPPRAGAALGQKQGDAALGKGRAQRLAVGVQRRHQQPHVAVAPAARARQPPRQRRGKARLLARGARLEQLHAPGRFLPAARRGGEQLRGEKAQLVRQRPALAGFGKGDLHVAHPRRLHKAHGRGAQGEENVPVARLRAHLQRQKHRRIAHFRHGGDEAVQRRRHHVKAVEPQPRPAQKRRSGGPFRRQRQFALAVLKAPGHLPPVGGEDGGHVFQFARKRAMLPCGAGAHFLRPHAGLTEHLHLFGGAQGKAPPRLRAPVEGQFAFDVLHGAGDEHHPSAVVHAHALGPPRGVEDEAAEPLRAQHAQAKRALQGQALQQKQLRLQRKLLGHHHAERLPARLQGGGDLPRQRRAQRAVAAREQAQHAIPFPRWPSCRGRGSRTTRSGTPPRG